MKPGVSNMTLKQNDKVRNRIYAKWISREVLKKIRTRVRRAATELSNSIKIEIEKENASSDLIEELLAKLIDKEKQLENVDKDITILTNMDDLEKEIEKQNKNTVIQ
ncbi:hypothetical protein TNCV_1344261 [Trichonephila clavipes]|nr:hypothetical protein TNCV_1344261 [Trichonephila clavipes]